MTTLYDLCDMKIEGNGGQIIVEMKDGERLLFGVPVYKNETHMWVDETRKFAFNDMAYMRNSKVVVFS